MADAQCAQCGTFIDSETGGERPEERRPCPNCESVARNYRIRLQGSIAVSSRVAARLTSTRELFDIDVPSGRATLTGPRPNVVIEAVGSAAGTSDAQAEGRAVRTDEPTTEQSRDLPGLLVNAAIVVTGDRTCEGQLIAGVSTAWFEIVEQLQRDPQFLYSIDWRRMEELIAGAYERSGCPNVVLTPRSNDKGRDVIATWPGVGAIRIVDQVKAYAPGHCVNANDVRAMLGVLSAYPNVSKGLITTTSDFAPGVKTDVELQKFMPSRLELKDGPTLISWLRDIADKKRSS